MRAVVQRVSAATVSVDEKVVGQIGRGLLVYLGVERDDEDRDLDWLIEKIPQIRCFEDEDGRMNRSLIELGGEAMVISQFTLFGNLRKGSRPSFNRAAPPEKAIPIYEEAIERLSSRLGRPVASGVFGADMQIESINDGPVTLVLDSQDKAF